MNTESSNFRPLRGFQCDLPGIGEMKRPEIEAAVNESLKGFRERQLEREERRKRNRERKKAAAPQGVPA